MPTGQLRSEYESHLDRAHRALYKAAEVADLLQDYGAAEDLYEILHYLHDMVEDSIRSKKRPRRQLPLLDS